VGDKITGKIVLSKNPLALQVACDTDNDKIIWYSRSGSEVWNTLVVESAEVTIPGSTNDDEYCIRYLATDEQARDAIITSNIIPEELYLIITAPIFSGDACATANGKFAGTLTFEIPRFKLNGAQNFTFNMSSNTTMELSGTALADFSGCDMINGQLVRVIETVKGRTLNEGLVGIIVDAATGYVKGTNAPLYGIYDNGTVAVLVHANGGDPTPPGMTAINTQITSDSPYGYTTTYCINGIVHFGNAAAYTLTYSTGYSNLTTTFGESIGDLAVTNRKNGQDWIVTISPVLQGTVYYKTGVSVAIPAIGDTLSGNWNSATLAGGGFLLPATGGAPGYACVVVTLDENNKVEHCGITTLVLA